MRPAVFLDRDGILNKDKGYVYRIEDFEWIPGSKQAIKFINEKKYYIFVVTNQSGIARGYYSENDVLSLHNYIIKELKREEAFINEFFYSPYHPDFANKYSNLSHLRKPNVGMLDLACKKWKVNRRKSLMIGDSESDMICAKNFGIKGHLFTSSNLLDFVKSIID